MENFRKLLNYLKIVVLYEINAVEFFFKYYLKLNLFILNAIVNNYVLCLIYILVLIHGFFGNMGAQQDESYHWVSRFVVCYLQVSSIEIFLVCHISIARKYLMKVFGREFFLTNFKKTGEIVLKYTFPYFFLLALEIFTIRLRSHYILYLHDACTARYEQVHGFDGFAWSDMVKQDYHAEQANILSGSLQGLTCAIGDDLTVLINFLVDIIKNFF